MCADGNLLAKVGAFPQNGFTPEPDQALQEFKSCCSLAVTSYFSTDHKKGRRAFNPTRSKGENDHQRRKNASVLNVIIPLCLSPLAFVQWVEGLPVQGTGKHLAV
jgi:hypothetical protein